MAFEDRCSPQSAPSPPGIPHSPQKTSIVLAANESQNSFDSYTIDQEMSIMVPAVSNSHITSAPNESNTTNTINVECNTSPSLHNG